MDLNIDKVIMSHVGLSIEESSSSISCSDLSESETSSFSQSWAGQCSDVETQVPFPPPDIISMSEGEDDHTNMAAEGFEGSLLRPIEPHSVSLPNIAAACNEAEGSQHHLRISPPRRTGYRSGVRRRLEELERRHSGVEQEKEPYSSDDDLNCPGGPIRRQRHSSRLRVYFTLCAVCFVTFTLNSANTASQSIITTSSEIRRDEVTFPLHHPDSKQHHQLRSELPKYFFPKIEQTAQVGEVNDSFGGTKQAPKIRTNIAMALAPGPFESRPFFEPKIATTSNNMDRFIMLDERKTSSESPAKEETRDISITSWVFGFSVLFALLKEFWQSKRSVAAPPLRRRADS